MTLEIRRLTGDALSEALPQVAALRIEVFRDWPYLYDGDIEYEEAYLAPYKTTPETVLIGAYAGAQLVGASTGMPLAAHDEDFRAAFDGSPYDPSRIFYCAESVLLPQYRGLGVGHRFFELREAVARAQGLTMSVFCAVRRAPDHPARPPNYRPLDAFWHKRGYRPLLGVTAHFTWKDVGDIKETCKPLDFWGRELGPTG